MSAKFEMLTLIERTLMLLLWGQLQSNICVVPPIKSQCVVHIKKVGQVHVSSERQEDSLSEGFLYGGKGALF